jgi:hypothetical protein
MKPLRVQNWNASDFAIQLQNRPSKSFTNLAGANRTIRILGILGTVAQRPQHTLEYCTGLHLVG